MPDVPTPPTILPGDIPDGDDWQALEDCLIFEQEKPAAMLRRANVQSIGTGSYTSVELDAEDLDNDPDGVGGHSNSTNPSRYTARYAGWYHADGGFSIAASATGRRGSRWTKNGSAVSGSATFSPPNSSGSVDYSARGILVSLAVGDYLELQVYQDSGGSLNTGTGEDAVSMNVHYVRRA